MYKDELSIFIPNSFLSESKDLKIRTYKVGIIARALAIFQADNVVIYNDNHEKNCKKSARTCSGGGNDKFYVYDRICCRPTGTAGRF